MQNYQVIFQISTSITVLVSSATIKKKKTFEKCSLKIAQNFEGMLFEGNSNELKKLQKCSEFVKGCKNRLTVVKLDKVLS
jgi:hypothetical protein